MRNSAQFFIIIAVVLAIILFILLSFITDWSLYPIWLVALSGATLMLYAVDKLQARLNNWRIPESTLHLFALLGGSLGGWMGMVFFWHKIRKPVFWFVLIISSILHLGLWFLL